MLRIQGYQITEVLHTGSKTLVCRGFRQQDHAPVIFKTHSDNYPAAKDLACLQHEYTLTKECAEDGLLHTYSLLFHQHRQVLIQQDIGGISLKQLLAQQTLSLEQFFEMALALAQSLGKIHQRLLIHKDINPSNVVVNPQTGQVQIIDFGIATQLSREALQLQAPEQLEGTLAYLSPEQTGRMNRSLDYRTDFYSLGASFYEMLTGVAPFNAADPMELVHCHLAKMPRPAHELRPELPPQLSALVDKLMAKTAEERYQSSFGLCADLTHCHDQYHANGTISAFALGRYDVSARFKISQKLYGRETAVQQVLESFTRVSQGQTDILLLAGDSGIGKTALAHEVVKPITQKNGYFIDGKFDQFQRGTPYASIIEAFQKLVRQILTESQARIARWKTRLTQALGVNAQIIIDVIPDLQLILGPQAAAESLPPQEARNRFLASCYQFIGVFARAEHPLVLFLDDLQWADSASLQLLETLLRNFHDTSLLILAAFRDNEVHITHPFALALESLHKTRPGLCVLKLQALGLSDLQHLVQDTLTPTRANTAALAELILHKTAGNPFFVNAFLTRLYEQGCLRFSATLGGWQWNMTEIEAQQITDNVVELVAQKMRTLPLPTRQLLVVAACIGHQFDLATLTNTMHSGNSKNTADTLRDLWVAAKAGLLQTRSVMRIEEMMMMAAEPGADAVGSDVGADVGTDVGTDVGPQFAAPYRFGFVHDRVQQAAYELLPAAETAALHLQIGRLWLKQLHQTNAPSDEALFAVTNQFNTANNLIHHKAERVQVAQLHLQAGQKAIAATAFSSALRYLDNGLNLLDGGDWENHYPLTMALFLVQAECETINHQHEMAQQHFATALQHAKTATEKANIHMRQMELFGSQGNYQRAVDEGRAALQLLGIHLPRHPSKYHVLPELWLESWHRRTAKLALTHRQPSQQPEHSLAIRIFASLAPFASFVNLPLTALVSVKAVNLLYRHGTSSHAAYMLMTFSATLIPLKRYQLALDYANQARELGQRPGAGKQLVALHMFANWINPWFHPLHTSTGHLEECLKLALETGNWMYAAFSMVNLLQTAYASGQELSVFLLQAQKFERMFEQMNNPNRIGSFCTLAIAWAETLREHSQPEQATMRLNTAVDDALSGTPNKAVHFFIHTLACFSEFLFENYKQAATYLQQAKKTRRDVVGMQISSDYAFLHILITLAQHKSTNHLPKPLLQTLQRELNTLAGWAKQCPHNFAHKHLLAAAEMARVAGRRSQAQDLYDDAIDAARKNGFIQHQALACECAARFYLARQKNRFAQVLLEQAHYLYGKWGACAKLRQLEEKYPNLDLRSSSMKNSFKHSHTGIATGSTPSNSNNTDAMEVPTLDLATVMKATQAISGEMVLGKLLQKLIHLLIENAGAQYGVLLLETDGEWRIEAQGNVNDTGTVVSVLQSCPVVPPLRIDVNETQAQAQAQTEAEESATHPTLPNALIRYVVRTQQPFVLNHACARGRFKHHTYIRQNRVKSILCAPILHQGKLAGILYLENKLMEAAFTVDRLGVLMVFSSQAAISIENARMYENLESTVAQRTAALRESSTALADAYSVAETARQHAEAARQAAESAEHQATQTLGDLRVAQNRLVQSEKMAALGHLVAGVAHELNTPIGNVLVTSSLLHEKTRELNNALNKGEMRKSTLTEFIADAMTMTTMISRFSERAASLVNSFKEVAVDQSTEPRQVFSLNTLVRESITALHTSLAPEPWQIDIDIPAEIVCNSYPGALGQVIGNLLQNAWTHAFTGRATGRVHIAALANSERVELIFKDDGNGMNPAQLAHIFEPFYTTRPGQGGPGLGLSISLNIVTGLLGGTLEADSVPGSGTRFEMRFPLVAPERTAGGGD